VAVLPFTNLSGDPDQEYLSDGLSEEILNALARIDGLKVAARSSTFSFKGKNVDIAVIARKLNVGTVLEGSVRRSAQKVRVAAQLINATTGFHLWSQTYDNKLSDVLDLQAKVAMAVANQLDVALSGNALAKIGQGGTRNAAAFDAYLRGTHVLAHADSLPEYRRAVAAFDESVARDPNFGAAYALRASALTDMSVDTRDLALLPGIREQARQSAEKAVAFAPELAEAYESRGFVRAIALLDFGAAGPDFERALSLAPGSALVQKGVALYSSLIGHHDVALAADSLAVELDPENHATLNNQFVHLIAARRFPEALRAIHAYEAAGGTETVNEEIGGVYLAMGHPEAALKVCESTRASPNPAYRCLAMAYHALGNHIQAEAALRSNIAKLGDAGAFEYAEIFAQRGELAEALKWLETAARLRLPDIQNIRRDWMLDPVRTEPAYKSIERRFNFPP
jgi:serine/threonine-protein kinase